MPATESGAAAINRRQAVMTICWMRCAAPYHKRRAAFAARCSGHTAGTPPAAAAEADAAEEEPETSEDDAAAEDTDGDHEDDDSTERR